MPFSIQVQLKRLADLLVAVALLLITVPFYWACFLFLFVETVVLCYTASREVAGWVDLSLFISCEQCVKSTLITLSGPSLVTSE